MKSPRTVLVTGGCGFLGRFVVAELQAAGTFVVCLDAAAPECGNGFLAADLTQMAPDLSEISPRFVLHLAGLAHHVPRDASSARKFYESNVEGTRSLLAALDASGERQDAVVFLSTVAVYGLQEGEALDEETARLAGDPFDSRVLTKMNSSLTFSDEKARAMLGRRSTHVVDAAKELVA